MNAPEREMPTRPDDPRASELSLGATAAVDEAEPGEGVRLSELIPLVPNFPVDHPRARSSQRPLRRMHTRIDVATVRALDRLCQSEQANLFEGVHAAFALLLGRLSGERQVSIATPIAHRTSHCIVDVVLARAETFSALLRRSRDSALDLRKRYGVSLPSLEHAAQRDAQPTELFRIRIATAPIGSRGEASTANGEFALAATRHDAGLELEWRYAPDVLEEATVALIARRFAVLLESVGRRPDDDSWRVPVLDRDERQRVLADWNDTRSPLQARAVHELFAEQVERTPAATAVVCGGAQLTYRELDAQANRLARHLRARGVDTDCVVGVCLERSAPMIVGLLAILKAGGAYVPLDPQYPQERLQFMLADSGARWLLTDAKTLGRFGDSLEQIALDDPGLLAALQAYPSSDPPAAAGHDARALMNVIYTSGSTGRPKGVCIEHRQVAAFIEWARTRYDADALDGVLAATSICFDLSVFELFVTLCCGGRVLLLAHPLDFEGIAAAPAPTLINTVPSAMKALVQEGAVPASVTVVNLAGEPLTETLVNDIYRATAVKAVYNLYGPTEDTTYSTVALMPRRCQDTPPIGRPLSNEQAYVLDRDFEPVPIGVVGDLYLGGAGVGRGYWKRPGLTADRFVADPFGARPGARLYKTGDLARWSIDGELEFFGRADGQIKLHGFRIELGEIRVRLLEIDDVEDAIVIVRQEARGEPRLAAYIVPADVSESESQVVERCRRHLAARVPDHMVPAAFVCLAALPLTPNGKIDRAALPAPPDAPAPQYVAPRSALQEALARLWQEILQLPAPVGIHASFFDLGGDSILAMRLLARVRQEHRVAVSIRSLFAAPTVEGFAPLIAQGDESGVPAIQRVPRGGPLPLSFAQQRLWLIDQLEGGSAHYHLQLRFLVDGDLDPQLLRAAIEGVVQRHESLRTVIVRHDEQPRQVVREAVEIPFTQIDLRDLPAEDRAAETERIAERDALAPFALDRDSMLRVHLVRLSPEQHELLLTLHHIAADAWSLDLLATEIAARYDAMRQGREADMPALPVQYADYAVWQRAFLQGDVLEEQARYWLRQLADLPAVHGLPLDRPRRAQQHLAGAVYRTHLDTRVTQALVRACRQEQATLFMGLHAAFSLLLARYSGEGDIVVGTPIANREQPELAAQIGFFVNTMVLRSRVDAASTFTDLLRRSRQIVLDAYSHQQLPFEYLVERLQPTRSLSYPPLFQIMLALQNAGDARLALAGATVTRRAPHNVLAPFELTLDATETPDGLQLEWIYRREIFDAATIERLAAHFGRVVDSVIAQPSIDVWTLPLLDAGERRQIARWSTGGALPVPSACVHEVFEEQARQQPQAVAVADAAGALTYAELDRRANRCAHFLRAQGVRPETIVGICTDRSAEMAVGMLAVLKAGGVYLPLEGSLPPARIALMIDRARAPIVLTGSGRAGQLSTGATVVALDDDDAFAQWSDRPLDRSVSGVSAGNGAYLIYTSGSTGEPKGVINTHAGLLNLCRWHAAAFGTDRASRCTLVASIGFDAAVWELWATLLAGACAVPIDDTTRATPHLLAEVVQAERITHCFMPTGLLEAMSETAAFSSPHLRVLLCGGDKLTRYCLRPDVSARLVNCYGPTEAAVVSTSYDMTPERAPLIGSPIANVHAYVLNDAQELQPVGVIGELYVGGASLARGYLNAPGLTAERFIADPFSGTPGARLYRTGDFARLRSDGNIEIVGRRDKQVKMRGVRIELGEIESRLSAMEAVRSAVVLRREDTPGRPRLAGYVLVDRDRREPELADDIRAALRRALPEHMVPDAIVVLHEWPVTANGKIDRTRLPRPADPEDRPSSTPPTTAAERAVHEIWARLLNRSDLGIDLNFFEAGGHSLLVTQMIHLLGERLGATVNVRDVFRCPTIRGLAAAIESGCPRDEAALAPPSDANEFPLSLCQFRIWYVEQTRETNEHNMPVVLELRGHVDRQLLARALNHVIDRHDMLRTTFALNGDARQVTRPSCDLELAWCDLADMPAAAREGQARTLAIDHATRRFDIARPPLVRALLVRTAVAEYALHLNFHHLVFDGWSSALFFNELIAAYEAIAGGTRPTLPAPRQRYADFVAWQHRWIDTAEARAQAAFWRDYLQGSPEHLSLAGHAAWPRDDDDSRTRVSACVPAATRQRLLLLAQETRGTLFSVLYAAFALLLGRLDGQHDLTIGIPVSGRHVPGMQDVIGNLLNNLPVRTRWDARQRFGEYLTDQVANLQQVLSSQDYPFEKILELAPHLRSADATPIFQVFFNMIAAPPAARPRLFEARLIDGPEIEPKFNLTLYVEDDGGDVRLTCHYKRERFSPRGIEHLLDQYAFLLEQIASDAQRPCGEYSLRAGAPDERAERPEPPRSWIGAVHEIFRARAIGRPHAPAIIEPDQEWTYGDVLRASGTLAQMLRQHGIGPGDVVGIVAARRASLAVSMLGVLQSGAAFSMLDPDYPVERLCTLVDIATIKYVLFAGERSRFDARLTARLEQRSPCAYVPAAKPAADVAADGFEAASVEPQQLACVTFTSGTTGIPKAVAGTHIGLAGYLTWVPQWLRIDESDRFSLLSGLGHDPVQRDVFTSLCLGATLVIPAPQDVAPHALAQWLRRHAITFVHLTPAMVEMLCTTDESEFPSLRIAFVTGDKLRTDTVRKLVGYNASISVLNSYGTTETQRATTYFVASDGDSRWPLVPISEASPDTVIRVLNEAGVACGLGELGDIIVESHALSRGYLNDPALTDRVMGALPSGCRRYRTGDIGCRLPGAIVLPLGRKDTQVKIHGYRIETGEIEAHARGLPGIRDAAVLALPRPSGESELVAYAVASDARSTDTVRAQLQDHLRSQLPPYMMPGAIVFIDKLPLTPNGKLDRRALPEPAWDAAAGSVAPRTDLERAVAEIWMEVLGLSRVGVEDDFFALGGHSVLMVLLLTRLRERLGRRVSLRRMLSCLTIAEQARALGSNE